VGSPGSAVANPIPNTPGPVPGYLCLDGPVPLFHAPRLAEEAREVRGHLERGSGAMAAILGAEAPALSALLVADEDWSTAPRENEDPYPPGLPYFTRSVEPPTLVLPETLAPVFRPRTGALLPLTIWHELAHAFLLNGEVVRTPGWLGELLPQAASAAVARRVGLPLGGHLRRVDPDPGFTVRGFAGPAGAAEQMRFQNLLLLFAVAALDEFGEGFLGRMSRALWDERDVVGAARAGELLAVALGPGGREWLRSRPEF
jgi:hypothetical protein